MSTLSCPGDNHLLAAFPAFERSQLRKYFTVVTLEPGQVLREAVHGVRYVCFPTTALVSIQYLFSTGVGAEFALVGSDGVVGVEGVLGGQTTPSTALVIGSGHAWRIREDLLAEAFERSAAIRQLLLRYALAFMSQVGQAVVCNRHHSVQQQLFRSLLASLDHSDSGEISMTHDLLAHRLGVRREGITEAAYKAQAIGLIKYQRGRITVLSRARLEARTCECYAVVKREGARLLPARIDAPWCGAERCASCTTPSAVATRDANPTSTIASR